MLRYLLMMNPRSLVISAALWMAAGPLHAQTVFDLGEKGPAYTQPPQDDGDYDLLGEFSGPLTLGENEYEPLGLQIRPIGDGNFEAVSFMGGLPGEKTHRPEPVKMIGRRSGDFVILSGGPYAVFVEKQKCLIVNREGETIGRLERVKRSSPTLDAPPPAGAIVLFDGTDTDQFTSGQMTKDRLLKEGTDIKPMFQDFDLHLEFLLPYMPQAQGQSRANSGIYLQSRYECQVLDSFGLDRMINGCGAIYRFRKPEVNMCFPPLVWQTYDIRFTAPRWAADGSKVRDAHLTSWINGVKVQDDVRLPNKTGAGKQEEPLLLPTKLQNHGDPVRFRNIWVIDRGLTPGIEFPVFPTPEQLKAARKAKQAKAAKEKAAQQAAKKQAQNGEPTEAAEPQAANKAEPLGNARVAEIC